KASNTPESKVLAKEQTLEKQNISTSKNEVLIKEQSKAPESK
ncbi:1549_t:CDS:1, partial [Racocetra persica]